jgi:hypothetical protein
MCHDDARMLRKALIVTLCLAVAILGVSGMHVHVPGPLASGHLHVPEADQHEDHVFAVSAMQGDHDAEHGEHGDIDIEPLAKAFTKLSVNQLIPALALICAVIALLVHSAIALPLRPRQLRRSPRRYFLPHFLPPSHAPPAATSSR